MCAGCFVRARLWVLLWRHASHSICVGHDGDDDDAAVVCKLWIRYRDLNAYTRFPDEPYTNRFHTPTQMRGEFVNKKRVHCNGKQAGKLLMTITLNASDFSITINSTMLGNDI